MSFPQAETVTDPDPRSAGVPRVDRDAALLEGLRRPGGHEPKARVADLDADGIDAVVLDTHTSIIEGSIGAIPRRLMVATADHARAQALLAAGEAAS